MAPACLSFITLSLIASACSLESWIDFWSIADVPCKYVNISFEKLNKLFLLLRGRLSPYLKELLGVPPMTTFSMSSHFASSVAVSGGDTGAFDCYKSFSVEAEDSTSNRCEMAATTHCLAADCQPWISRTWSPDGNFTF